MRGVHLNYPAPIGLQGQNLWAEQGDVMEMHYVVLLAIEYIADVPLFEVGLAGLLGEQR